MRQIPLIVACLLLVGCNEKPTDELLEQLRDKDSAQRLRAVKALGEKRSDADKVVPALAQVLKDNDAFVRRYAARSLGQFGSAASSEIPALQVAARDRNHHVRQAATEALRKVAPDLSTSAERR